MHAIPNVQLHGGSNWLYPCAALRQDNKRLHGKQPMNLHRCPRLTGTHCTHTTEHSGMRANCACTVYSTLQLGSSASLLLTVLEPELPLFSAPPKQPKPYTACADDSHALREHLGSRPHGRPLRLLRNIHPRRLRTGTETVVIGVHFRRRDLNHLTLSVLGDHALPSECDTCLEN